MSKTMQTVTVIINKDGSTEIGVEGVAGAGCLKATKSLEEALGVVQERTPTADMGKKGPVVYDKTQVGN
jgi:hypothetical protein